MKLKGNWNNATTYDVEDVVLFTDDVSYHLQHPCPAGTPPVDTRYWSRTSQEINNMVHIAMDAISIANSDDVDPSTVPTNISDDAILLNSSTEGSNKQFLITVDDEGEITTTEVEEDET